MNCSTVARSKLMVSTERIKGQVLIRPHNSNGTIYSVVAIFIC